MIEGSKITLAKITKFDFTKGRPVLIVEFPGFKKSFSLNKEVFSIGRHPNNSLVLEDKQVSRCHATIAWLKYQDHHSNWQRDYWIIDGKGKQQRSSNGIFINETKKSHHRLRNGDIITIGHNVAITYRFVAYNTQNNNMLKTVYYL
ncbi:FHA domain-containing protein [Xenococcus sp. PCC 7305]|uniref:FHA domain-containing protein n=1 Tax=Xenococcus sp. PCC 7305 TaxID=102125 RepID=UPI0002AD05B1|nr:FHA domain-containing protein [Xenococcus sp. PCC 7305]ELS04679.1 FHA domain-containing protein [Xenococcus sp. PCC 7305]